MADDISELRGLGPNADGLLAEAATLDIDSEPAPESGGEKHAEKQKDAATAKGRAKNVDEVKSDTLNRNSQ